MSNEVHTIGFSNREVYLEMKFEGENYHAASVKMTLKGPGFGHILEELPAIPVSSLLQCVFLMNMSIRRTEAQYEKEVQELAEKIKNGKHPMKGDGDGAKENKKK